MTVSIWTGQFNLVNGQPQEEGPYVGVFEGTRGAVGVGIYLVVEPVGGASPRLCDEVIETIARTFGSPEQQLTGNLMRAFTAAHDHVRAWARVHAGEGKAGVAVSCLAVRDDEAYLAQCGPALALAHTSGRFRMAAPSGEESRRPIGQGDRTAPVFTRFTLVPGDVVLLAYGSADRLIDHGTLISLVSAPPEEALPALYVRVRELHTFGALYVGVNAARVEEFADPAPAPRNERRPTPRRPEMKRPAAEDSQIASPSTRPAGPPPGATVRVRPIQRPEPVRRPPSGSLGSLGNSGFVPTRRMLVWMVVAIGVIAFLALVVSASARQADDTHFAELMHSANSAMESARTETDPARLRELFTSAQANLMEARAIHPEDGAVAERLDSVDASLQSLARVRELANFDPVADLSSAGIAPGSALELAVGPKAYVLDSAEGRVFAVDRQSATRPEIIFSEGIAVGPDRTSRARHLALVPDGTGGTGTLIVLDAGRRLWSLSPDGGWAPVSLGGTDQWRSDTAIAATPGALYILDGPGEQVWRYSGTLGAYDARPEPLVVRGPLKDATSLSVAGTPLVSTGDSKLLRIADGRADEVRPSGIDRALIGPFAPVFNPADAELYVADRGNQRVVVLDGTGAFARQYSGRRLVAMRALALDQAGSVLYAISGGSLYTAPLPR